MNKSESKDLAALEILKSTRVDVLEAALIAKKALTVGRGRMKRALHCIEIGAEELQRRERTVSFRKAVEAALEARQDRRPRTQWDFRYFTSRLMKKCKGLAKRRVRSIRTKECTHFIEEPFDTPRQRQKARLILSGVFSTAVKRGWCNENPITLMEVPKVKEQKIAILTPVEIRNLLVMARSYHGGICLAAVGMMLYAGIRPHEVTRLSWEEVDLEERCISIQPQHSKTGGSRMVTIHPPLLRLLQTCISTGKICPPRWNHHWRTLRISAGFSYWVPDVLRHTFATYHLCHFRNYSELQYETGHRDSTLLRTRYVNMKGVSKAAQFWE